MLDPVPSTPASVKAKKDRTLYRSTQSDVQPVAGIAEKHRAFFSEAAEMLVAEGDTPSYRKNDAELMELRLGAKK